MQVITRRGPQQLSADEFRERRAPYSSTLVDLGTGDGAWPRRFARDFPQCLAIGVDSDRDALRAAAKLAERKPARGGAPNALYVAAQAESLPPELRHVADWITIYFPWSALLQLILSGDPTITRILTHLSTDRARCSLVLNADAPPDGFERPTPQSLPAALESSLGEAGYRITSCAMLDRSETPQTTWGGRLVKGSDRTMLGLEALR